MGWVNKENAILLDDAIPYFTSLLDRDPKNWVRTYVEQNLNMR